MFFSYSVFFRLITLIETYLFVSTGLHSFVNNAIVGSLPFIDLAYDRQNK